MRVFRYRLQDAPEVYHAIAVDRLDAVLDICELWRCSEADITALEQVQRLTVKKQLSI
jgi:hypothetical protein